MLEIKEPITKVNFQQHPFGFMILTQGTVSPDDNSVYHHGNKIVNLKSTEIPKKRLSEYKRNVNYTQSLIQAIFNFSPKLTFNSPLVDLRYRDQCYWRFNDETALYICPSLSVGKDEYKNAKNMSFPKVKEFVLASCLFGASILGRNKKGNAYPLIDHQLEVESIIEDIQVCEEPHPYELMVFAAFTKLIPMMQSLGTDDFIIRYHLPVIDYMLYGVRLFIQGKLEFEAFSTYVDEIKARAKVHKKILSEIAQQKGVKILIESPFDNLLDKKEITAESVLEALAPSREQISELFKAEVELKDFIQRINNQKAGKEGSSKDAHLAGSPLHHQQVAQTLTNFNDIVFELNRLDCETEMTSEKDKQLTARIREKYEEFFVLNVLNKLQNNNEVPHHKDVWTKIINSSAFTTPKTLEEIFRIANTAVIAFARAQKDMKDFEVLSLLPVDEKPIYYFYVQNLSKDFGNITGLSWLPPFLSYVNSQKDNELESSNKQNNLFRFRPDLYELDFEETLKVIATCFSLPSDWCNLVRSYGFMNLNSDYSIGDSKEDEGYASPQTPNGDSKEEEDEDTIFELEEKIQTPPPSPLLNFSPNPTRKWQLTSSIDYDIKVEVPEVDPNQSLNYLKNSNSAFFNQVLHSLNQLNSFRCSPKSEREIKIPTVRCGK